MKLILIAVAATVAVAGCGGTSHESFMKDLTTAEQPIAKQLLASGDTEHPRGVRDVRCARSPTTSTRTS